MLAPLREDLDAWRRVHGGLAAPVFPSAQGSFWRASDWRKGVYRPVAEDVVLSGARPYDLRHAFASLLIHEGRPLVVEIAAPLGHNPTVCLDTYAHVMAEQSGGEKLGAEEQIVMARRRLERGPRRPAVAAGGGRLRPRVGDEQTRRSRTIQGADSGCAYDRFVMDNGKPQAWTEEEARREEEAERARVRRDAARGVSENLRDAVEHTKFARRFAAAFEHNRRT